MADAQTLRTEIKSWERAFKNEHQRTPTVEDIKDNPDIAAKYKLYKKLNKSTQEKAEQGERQNVPRTPSPKPTPRQNQPSILRKAAAVHTGSHSDANPFSPTKKRPVASSSKQRVCDGHNEMHLEASHLQGGVAALSLSRTLPATQDAPNEIQPPTVVSKARKRLRGDPVSPSPNRPEKKARRHPEPDSPPASPTRPRNAGNDEDNSGSAELSFFDESPVKLTSGKNFKSLFDETERPLPRLLFQSGPESKQTVGAVLLDSTGKSGRLFNVDKKGGQKAQPKLNAFGILSGHSRRKFENTLNSSNGQQDHDKPVTTSNATRKRPVSPVEVDGHEAGAQSSSSGNNMLLPPSPTLSAQTAPKYAKGFSSNRKKAKTKGVFEDVANSDEEDANNALHVIDLDMNDLRRRGLNEESRDGDIEDDDMLFSMRNTEARGDSSHLSDDEAELDIDIPPDMREYLHISPSRARERDEVEIVDSLLQGSRRCARIIKGEVWGVGEIESEHEDGAHTEGDDDWDGEGLPWEAAELSDFEGNA